MLFQQGRQLRRALSLTLRERLQSLSSRLAFLETEEGAA